MLWLLRCHRQGFDACVVVGGCAHRSHNVIVTSGAITLGTSTWADLLNVRVCCVEASCDDQLLADGIAAEDIHERVRTLLLLLLWTALALNNFNDIVCALC